MYRQMEREGKFFRCLQTASNSGEGRGKKRDPSVIIFREMELNPAEGGGQGLPPSKQAQMKRGRGK